MTVSLFWQINLVLVTSSPNSTAEVTAKKFSVGHDLTQTYRERNRKLIKERETDIFKFSIYLRSGTSGYEDGGVGASS
jgi:hypothetical protein